MDYDNPYEYDGPDEEEYSSYEQFIDEARDEALYGDGAAKEDEDERFVDDGRTREEQDIDRLGDSRDRDETIGKDLKELEMLDRDVYKEVAREVSRGNLSASEIRDITSQVRERYK